jgi:putative membrane protein
MNSSLNRKNQTVLKVLILAWAILLIVTGLRPRDQLTWLLEVFPVLVAIPVLFWTRKKFPLPTFILIWIFIHGVILMVGGHYTYAEVPLGFWFRDTFHLARNHFDRLGHFMQGFVPALIASEILARKQIIRGDGWRFFITVTICVSISVAYEFIEWAAALILDQGAEAFLGTQGDPWDTQWDLFLATVGAIVAQSYPGKFRKARREAP